MSWRPALDGPAWSVGDFLVVLFSGFAASFALAAVAAVFGSEEAGRLVAASAGQSAGHLIGAVAVVRRHRGRFLDLGLVVEARDGAYLVLGVIAQIALALAFRPVFEALGVEESPQAFVEALPDITQYETRIALVILVGLVAPVMEELAFRGVLLRALGRRMALAGAITVTALAFAAVHLLGVTPGTTLPAATLTLVQFFLVGVLLCWLAVRHERLGPAIFTHAGFNLVAVALLFFAPELLEQGAV